MSQLVMIDGNDVLVLGNDLREGVAVGGGAAAPDGVGFWVAPRNGGLEVTIRTMGRTVRGMEYGTTMTEFVLVRN